MGARLGMEADEPQRSSSTTHHLRTHQPSDPAKVPIIGKPLHSDDALSVDIETACPLDQQPPHTPPQASLLWIYVLSIANLGIGASWAL